MAQREIRKCKPTKTEENDKDSLMNEINHSINHSIRKDNSYVKETFKER